MCLGAMGLNPYRKRSKYMSKDYRSAITGKYVKESYAKRNPDTTVGEQRPKPKGNGGKGKGKKR